MTASAKKTHWLCLILTVLYFVLLSLIFVWYHNTLQKALNSAAAEYLRRDTEVTSEQINSHFENTTELMTIFAKAAEKLSADSPALTDSFMENGTKLFSCSRLALVPLSGEARWTNGTTQKLSDMPDFRKAVTGERAVDFQLKGPGGLSDEIYIFIPLKKAGKVIKVFAASFEREQFKALLPHISSKNRDGYYYIIDSKGDVLAAPQTRAANTFINTANVFDFSTRPFHRLNSKDPALKTEIAEGREGVLKYTFGTEHRYMRYSRLGINDWYLVYVLPASVLLAKNANYIDLAYYFGLTIFVLTFIIGTALLWAMNSQMNLTEEAKRSLNSLTSNIPGGVSCCLVDDRFTTVDISDGYLNLLECTREEFASHYKNAALFTVYPADREASVATVQEGLRLHGEATVEYRIVTPAGRVKWVLERGRLFLSAGGKEMYYSVVLDNTAAKASADELALSEERYRIVTENADEYLFDWNVATDEVYYSPAYRKRFGDRRIFNMVNMEDIKKFTDFTDRLTSGEGGSTCTEVRLSLCGSAVMWCSLQATPIIDANGKLWRVVGCMKDITDSVLERQKLLAEAQTDGLTGLLSKKAAQDMISVTLAASQPGKKHALFICDIDNFKNVNDTFGHLFGDTVLKQAGAGIKAAFRGGDITGRIGGDEFMVLMTNITKIEQVRQKLALILGAVRRTNAGTVITGSAGAAIFPDDAASFEELYAKADEALYRAKRSGKARAVIYGETDD